MASIKVRTNGVTPDNVVAEWESEVLGGSGNRKAILIGWSKSEIGARHKLLDQAKAMRDELNLAVEKMIEELCAEIAREESLRRRTGT